MPISRNKHARLEPLMEALQHYNQITGRRITFEYCMFQGFNDTEQDARNLARLCHHVLSKVNLIMYNTVPGLSFTRTSEEQLNSFIAHLVHQGVTVTVRRSRGADIAAACGQLAIEEKSLPTP